MSALESLAIQPSIYYTVEEAAHLLRVSSQSMLTLLETGKVRGVKIEGEWHILGAALLDLTEHEEQTERSLVSEWLAASERSLKEVWDNDEDAAYDELQSPRC